MTLKTQLLETIAKLSDEAIEETLQFVQSRQNPIRKTIGVCGGAARIRDTRIPVWTLVIYHQQGASTEELLQNYPGLTNQDLAAAWEYYRTHQSEIDQWIAEDE
ncbi:MAG: DUF433 domain-containing protein [Cyanobacteria bacterium]|nr:DUF433 domain-containing protein [Cyanobacteriota bacterium]